ncbi:MFS transporter [Trichothermofontia sp.]
MHKLFVLPDNYPLQGDDRPLSSPNPDRPSYTRMPHPNPVRSQGPFAFIKPEQRPILLVMLAAGGLTSVTGTIVAPILPEIVATLQVDPRWAGLLVSMHTLTTALFSPVWGVLADRIGKVKVLVPALLAYALFGAIPLWGHYANGAPLNSFEGLLLSRALVGMASAGIAAASIGVLGSLYGGESRTQLMGYATSVLSVTTIIFPILSGWIGRTLGWPWAFALYGLGIPVAVAVLLILREPEESQAAAVRLGEPQALQQTWQRPEVFVLFLGLGLASILFYIVIIYAPLHFKAAIAADTLLNGLILAARAVGAAVISAVGASRLASRVGSTNAIALGFALMALTLVMIPALTFIPWILLTALLFGVGFGVIMPNLYSVLSDLAPERQRAGVLAIGTGCSSLGQFISPLLLGPVWQQAGIAVFYVGGGVAIAIALLSGFSHRAQGPGSPSKP